MAIVIYTVLGYTVCMGKMNILKSDYVGKVGQTYGVRQYRQSLVKATPFSHTPHNDLQTKSVRAFEKLNRFSSYVAKTFWRYLQLSDRTMYRHNAVAKWLGVSVSSHGFVLANIARVIKPNSTLRLDSVVFDLDARKASVTFTNSPFNQYVSEEHIFIALVADNGTVKAGGVFTSASQTVELSWDYSNFVTLSCVMFKSSLTGKKWLVNGFCLDSEELPFVEDGILYTSRMPLKGNVYIVDGILKFSPEDAEVVDNVLHFIGL